MSTRSRIGIEAEDGTVRSIYCHWDGHPESAGMTLAWGYRTRERVEALVDLGDLSQPGENPEGCEAYHRDQGRPWDSCRPETHPDAEAFREDQEGSLVAYLYLFRQGGWRVADRNGLWRPLPRYAPGPGEG